MMILVNGYPLLPADKCESLSKLKEERLKLIDKALFQSALTIFWQLLEASKFKNVWILQYVLRLFNNLSFL